MRDHYYYLRFGDHHTTHATQQKREQPTTTTKTKTTTAMNKQEEDVFDDACDLGQFFVNPCYFIFMNLHRKFCYSDTTTDDSGQQQKKGDSHRQELIMKKETEKEDTQNKKKLLLTPRMQQIIYIVGVYGCWLVIFVYFYPLQAVHNDRIPDIHRAGGYFAFGSCLFTWIVASFWAHPGDINEDTLAKYDNYPYDDILYFDDCVCPTMHIRKLARSKFDRYTQRQVPRFDHFCGWLNQAIGEDNYRHFLVFLTVHTISCVYGSIMTARILWVAAYSSSYSSPSSSSSPDVDIPPFYLPVLGIVVWLLTVMAATLVAFLGFHLRNIARGMTTNEYFKWESQEEQQQILLASSSSSSSPPTPVVLSMSTISSGVFARNGRSGSSSTSTTMAARAAPAAAAASLSSSTKTQSTKARTSNSASSTSTTKKSNKVKKEVNNIYDLGIVGNFQEVFFPRSLGGQRSKKHV